jgi:hypothetical protein
VQVPGAVGGQDRHRPHRRPAGTELRDRHRALGEQFEQERLELVVGPVHLVDEQHRRARSGVVDRGQQRPGQEVVRAEQVGLLDGRALRLGQSDREQLPRVVPLVERLGRGEPLVALQPQQHGVECGRQRLGRLRLADSRLTLEQQRLPHAYGQEQRGRQALVGEVAGGVQSVFQRCDVGRQSAHDVL